MLFRFSRKDQQKISRVKRYVNISKFQCDSFQWTHFFSFYIASPQKNINYIKPVPSPAPEVPTAEPCESAHMSSTLPVYRALFLGLALKLLKVKTL